MMKNKIIAIGAAGLIVMNLIGINAFANTNEDEIVDVTTTVDFGASGSSIKDSYTLEEMLKYAIEDEYLAYAEYDLIINELEAERPFTNIIKAEATHIKAVEALYETYGLTLPIIDPSDYVILPESIDAALAAGVDAEIANIAMYERFLSQDLPDDVRVVFEALQSASESHLKAFEGGNGSLNMNGRGNTNNNNGSRQSNSNQRNSNQRNRNQSTENQLNRNLNIDCILTD